MGAFGFPCRFRCHHICVTPTAKRKGGASRWFRGRLSSAHRQGYFLSTHRGFRTHMLFPREHSRAAHPPAQQAPGDRAIMTMGCPVQGAEVISCPLLHHHRGGALQGGAELWAGLHGQQPSLGTQEQQGRRGCWSGSDLN